MIGAAKINTLSGWMQPRVHKLCSILETNGFRVEVYSARRTEAEQLALIAKGYTKARNSKHLRGDAVDLIITPSFGYAFAGIIWESFGGRWGGNFKDPKLAAVEFQHYEKLT